jgi:molybdopterin synthase sulfurtransferase
MSSGFKTITSKQLLSQLDKPDINIIDTRAVDAYNGWRQQGEVRGGHIEGARLLPVKWTNYMDWIEIVRSKGILPENKIVVYGYKREDIQKVAERFRKSDFNDVVIYEQFCDEWCADRIFPMNKLARYEKLVSPEWLHTLLNDGKTAEYGNDKFVLCHAHYRNRAAYDDGHIPGAIEIDTNLLESQETWNRWEPEVLKRNLEAKGITSETTVILYGRFSFPINDDPFPGSSAGHLGSIRCALIMMYAGVKDVSILNGGLQSWQDAGYEISGDESAPIPVLDFGRTIPAHPELFIDVPEAKEYLASEDCNLVCVRSWPELIGQVSGYNYIKKKGRIPGAVFGNCGTDAYHMENYRNLDHTMREYHEVEEIWKEAGITTEKKNAFYCGTGWRGSEAFMNAWLMGWLNVSVYDGGWFEWSNNPENPFETGLPG